MKLGAQMLAFRERSRIIPAINQFEGIVDKVVVACSTKPWEGDLEPDDTAKLANTTFAQVYENFWPTEAEQRNFCMEKLADCDWVLIAPPDRLFTRETLSTLKHFLKDAPKVPHGMFTLTYWKDTDTVILPNSYLNEAVVPSINKDQVPYRFTYANTSGGTAVNPVAPGIAHHISWVKTDEEIKTKITSYTHAKEIIPGWYENVWLNWREDMTNFAPTEAWRGSGGVDYKSVARYSLPQELRNLLARNEVAWLY